jgi:hypothetical protein
LGQLLGHQLQGFGLSGARRARHEAVPVDDGQRNLDLDFGIGGPIQDGRAEGEGTTGELVAGLDLLDLLGHLGHGTHSRRTRAQRTRGGARHTGGRNRATT